MKAADKIIVALDVPTVFDAHRIVNILGEHATFYKIGMELVFDGSGLTLCQQLIQKGKKVFLDMKLVDIDRTIMAAIEKIAQWGPTFTTVMCIEEVIKAAKQASTETDLKILAVARLTSQNIHPYGVAAKSVWAKHANADGIVCSGRDVQAVRKVIGPDKLIVVPGIRPAWATVHNDDQQRTVQPREAIDAGADYIVIGRPIVRAPNPDVIFERIVEELEWQAP